MSLKDAVKYICDNFATSASSIRGRVNSTEGWYDYDLIKSGDNNCSGFINGHSHSAAYTFCKGADADPILKKLDDVTQDDINALHSEITNTNNSIADKLTGTWVNAPMWRDENMTNSLYSQLSCSGCVCSMVFGFQVKYDVVDNNVCNVGYIPPAYRPATVIYCIGIMDGTTKAVLIEITTDGVVRVWGFNTNEIKAGSNITAGVTYIVSNAK